MLSFYCFFQSQNLRSPCLGVDSVIFLAFCPPMTLPGGASLLLVIAVTVAQGESFPVDLPPRVTTISPFRIVFSNRLSPLELNRMHQ